ncbi:hypothetical protein ACFSQD_16815 [Flavihumibacter stibioxidans]|uniref:AsmA-like C-terminal domain-containing protein n=1 Tax=Flavihumibacter stibioxidans TaxID=1834163 RepID=A0ABR7M6R4_9BACT|nr:hypothetical protein [Flavihumibacter stibioxidans]MBC6490728.1 hypothetical protein [Flavihumibacter stibioxidans]
MTRPSRKQWVLITIGAIFLALILSVGLFVRLRSVAAVKQLVETLSNGTYGFNASTIRVDPTQMVVRARHIHIYPRKPGVDDTDFELRADSLVLNLEDVLRLLFLNQLRVKSFTIVKPALALHVYKKDSLKPRELVPLHQQVARVQSIFFEVLQSLEVKKCLIRDGSVAYYPEMGNNRNRYFLNNIDLAIDDLHLLKKISNWNRDNQVALRFQLRQPVIEYPDTTIRVNLDKLLWDTRTRKFELAGFGFHKSLTEQGDQSGLRLENIELDSLNWNKLLTEGVVELGELKASKGYFSSNDFRFRKTMDSLRLRNEGNLLDIIGPILVKNLAIKEIEFTTVTHTRRGRENLRIEGENFNVSELLVDKDLPNKIELQELELKVRAYVESGGTKNFQVGFGEININKNNLILTDYFLHSPKGSWYGENSIDVKQLVLVNLSIPALLNGRLKAEELVLGAPVIRLNLPPKRKSARRFPWQRIQRNIARKLDIGTIRILDADVSVTQSGQQVPLVQTDSFFAVIPSRYLLRARDLDSLFRGENSFMLPRLALRIPGWWIDCSNVSFSNQTFSADSTGGFSEDGRIRFDLRQLKAGDINLASIFTGRKNDWMNTLEVGSGSLEINITNGPGTSSGTGSGATDLPPTIVKNIRSGPLQLRIGGNNWLMSTSIDTLSVDGLKNENDNWSWSGLMANGGQIRVKHAEVNGSAESFRITGDQQLVLGRGDWEINDKRFQLKARMEGIRMDHRISGPGIKFSMIRQIDLQQPIIDVLLKRSDAPEEDTGEETSTLLPAINLVDPTVMVSRESLEGRESLFSARGGKISTAAIEIKDDRFITDAIRLDQVTIERKTAKLKLHLPSLTLHTGKIEYGLGEAFETSVLALETRSAHIHYIDSGRRVSLLGVNARLQKPFQLNSSKDSMAKLFTILPQVNFQAEKIEQENDTRQFNLYRISMDAADKSLQFDSLSWTARLSRDSFFRSLAFEKDYITLGTGAGRLREFEYRSSGPRSYWHAGRLNLSDMDLLVERDKRITDDTVTYRPMLIKSLQQLPFSFMLEEIDLSHARIRYHEINEKNGAESRIWFTEMNGNILHAGNAAIGAGDSLRISLNTKLMGAGPMKFLFSQSYSDSLQGFEILSTVGRMNLDALSPLLQPLVNVRIKSGQADTVWMKVSANDLSASGRISSEYRDLKIHLLQEDGQKRGFMSFLANTVVPNKKKRSSELYRERLRNKSIFNYWGKIALSGLFTNLGIEKPPKKKKTK